MNCQKVWLASLLLCALTLSAWAQQPAAPSTDSARVRAPVDLTGTWVSVVTEDWAWRMQTPRKGDYASVPLNDAGRRAADTWTQALDGSCLAFGAAAALRQPTRLRIQWQDDSTLKIETDNGQQTRLLRFGVNSADVSVPRSLQGYSIASWQTADSVTGSGADGGIVTTMLDAPPWASLKVETSRMLAAWLRPNGVPYSENAKLTEYFDVIEVDDDRWFAVTTIVEDPAYLTEPFVISSNFKREPDAANWSPIACK